MIKPCPSFAGYGADEDGNIWSYRKNVGGGWTISDEPQKIMATFFAEKDRVQPRKYIYIRQNDKKVSVLVHRMVADAWLGPRPEGLIISHINDIAVDNRPVNLHYTTNKVNAEMRKKNQQRDIDLAYVDELEKRIEELQEKLAHQPFKNKIVYTVTNSAYEMGYDGQFTETVTLVRHSSDFPQHLCSSSTVVLAEIGRD